MIMIMIRIRISYELLFPSLVWYSVQRVTGWGGYFASRGSVAASWHSQNLEPVPETTSLT